MNLNLLLISALDFPEDLLEHMHDYGFSTKEARGRLKVKSLLEEAHFDAVVWCFEGYDRDLAQDLIQLLNLRQEIPLVLLSGDLEASDLTQQIKGTFGQLDLGEEPAELLKAIEFACVQPPDTQGGVMQEIDFRNLVRQVTLNRSEMGLPESPHTLKLQSAWVAVDGNEKRLLSTQADALSGGLWEKMFGWLKR
ncbi:MAG: hypothetical protein RRB13_05560 [bacterium]|nr:hypothetical protein [bacterium]